MDFGLDVIEVSPPINPTDTTVFATLCVILEFIAVIAREQQKNP
jgi:hypothetical protein